MTSPTAAERVARGATPKVSPAQIHALRGIAAGSLNRFGGRAGGLFAGKPTQLGTLKAIRNRGWAEDAPGTFCGIRLTDAGRAIVDAAEAGMPRYRVEFDRIGRTHNPPALEVVADSEADLEAHVFSHARRFLASRHIDVIADLETMTVQIFAGVRNGGTGTIAEVERRTGGAV